MVLEFFSIPKAQIHYYKTTLVGQGTVPVPHKNKKNKNKNKINKLYNIYYNIEYYTLITTVIYIKKNNICTCT